MPTDSPGADGLTHHEPSKRPRFLAPRRFRAGDWPLLLGSLVMLWPVVAMTRLVRGGSRVPYNDYWPMISSVLEPSGGLRVRGLFELRNEHPIAIPKFLYWIVARVDSGSNITLGYVVVAITIATVIAIAIIARQTPQLDRWGRITIVVASGWLLFSPSGSWYFVKSMSGAAWLTANLFVVAALAAQARRKTWLSIAFATAASISYGTGLVVWPALALIGVIRDRNIWKQWPIVVSGAVVVGGYWSRYRQIPDNPWVVSPTFGEQVDTSLRTLGTFIRPIDDGTSTFIGATVVVIGVLASFVVLYSRYYRRPDADAGTERIHHDEPRVGDLAWIGLLLQTLAGTWMLAGARPPAYIELPSGRYSVFGSMLCLSTFALVLSAAKTVPRLSNVSAKVPLVMGSVLMLLAGASGGASAESLRRTRAGQETLAAAFHMDLADTSRFWMGGLEDMPAGLTPLLKASNHLPFDRPFDKDCGLDGRMVAEDLLDVTNPVTGEWVRSGSISSAGVMVDGYVDVDGTDIDCIIVVGDTGRVRGTGTWGPPADGYGQGFDTDSMDQEGRTWFRLLARRAEVLRVWYRLEGETMFHEVPEGD